MGVRGRDDGTRILGPYLARVASCIARAWSDLEKIPPDIRANMSPRSRACIVNDQTVHYARQEFESDKTVAFVRGRGGLFMLGILGAFLLRFKKLRSNLRSSNIPTQQSMAFLEQAAIENTPAATHINAGYILNKMQTVIAGMYVTCPAGKRLEWVIDLAQVSGTNVTPMPQRPVQPKPRTTFVPKGVPAPKRTQDQENGRGDDDHDDDDNDNR